MDESIAVPIITQTNDEISLHMINTVDAKSATREAKLARSTPKPHAARIPRSRLLATMETGLTVNSPKTPKKSLRENNNNENLSVSKSSRQEVKMRQMSTTKNSGQDDDKENEDDEHKENKLSIRGSQMFGFNPSTKTKLYAKFKNVTPKHGQTNEQKNEEKEKEKENEDLPLSSASQKSSDSTNPILVQVSTSEKPTRRKRKLGVNLESATSTPAKSKIAASQTQKSNLAVNEDSNRSIKRRRNTRKLAKVDDTRSSSEESNASDEENEDGNVDAKNDKSDIEDETNSSRNFNQSSGDDVTGYDRYFQDLHTVSRTSHNTLSKLPVLDQKRFLEILSQVPLKHKREKEMLYSLHQRQFPQWYFELANGFNLIFYGYGSKRKLLMDFTSQICTDGALLVVNGYFPSVTIKEILGKITTGALQHTGPVGTPQEHTALIVEYFTQAEEQRKIKKLYLLIHNIDGVNLRNDKTQTALSILAACPNIHLIASMDHINTTLLWDNVKSARFSWCWHDVTTYDDYMVETSFENSLIVRQSELGSRGVSYVLASLTSNAKGIFRLLAEHQIAEIAAARAVGARPPKPVDIALAYNVYFVRCRENFLVSNDLTFKAQLTEFRDHKIIHSRWAPDGTEMLFIPLDEGALTGILENM